jgi:hypothetical protein
MILTSLPTSPAYLIASQEEAPNVNACGKKKIRLPCGTWPVTMCLLPLEELTKLPPRLDTPV